MTLGRGTPSLTKETATLLSKVTSFVGSTTYLHLYTLQAKLKICADEREGGGGGKHVKITGVRQSGKGTQGPSILRMFLPFSIVSLFADRTQFRPRPRPREPNFPIYCQAFQRSGLVWGGHKPALGVPAYE